MAMDPSTGYVKAYVGGPNYRYFKYDMVKQGKRQVGSTIKPFIYTFAIANLGYDPCTLVPNLPVTIETDNGTIWQPKEAGRVEYTGEMHPLRWGLANSRNNYSAWIMKQARQPQAVAEYIHRMGIQSYIDPVYSLCLGTPDVSLFEMVGAYGTFANRGVFTDPIFVTRIEDRNGNVLATFAPALHDAISEQTAYTMLGMMKNVVTSGTAGRLRWMYKFTADMAGKTGTSQKNSDAWFMGVTPKIVAGAWVGGEDRSVHLNSAADGARVALPIFAGFMRKVYDDPSLGVSESDQFPIPVGAVVYHPGTGRILRLIPLFIGKIDWGAFFVNTQGPNRSITAKIFQQIDSVCFTDIIFVSVFNLRHKPYIILLIYESGNCWRKRCCWPRVFASIGTTRISCSGAVVVRFRT